MYEVWKPTIENADGKMQEKRRYWSLRHSIIDVHKRPTNENKQYKIQENGK